MQYEEQTLGKETMKQSDAEQDGEQSVVEQSVKEQSAEERRINEEEQDGEKRKKLYNPLEPSSFILYLDYNSLYASTMCEPLPIGEYRFLNASERIDFVENKLANHGVDEEYGYLLDVDLDYSSELHALHNMYPLCPEHLYISEEMLSPFSKELNEKLGHKHCPKVKKLVPNLMDKRHYVLHYRNLQFYVKHGMKLIKVHSIMQFRQTRWIAKFIEYNTEMRKAAKSESEKSLWKLASNSVYGKFLEQLRNRLNVKLVTDQKLAEMYIAKPTFQSFTSINDDLTMIKLQKTQIRWTKPTIVGIAILEISKLLMYTFHYDVIQSRYRNDAQLLFTDTDSLCYHIKTEDVYKDLKPLSHLFDFSDYPKDHELYSDENKKSLNKMKDEANGKPPIEFVGLRSKMYSLLLADGSQKSTIKGIKKQYAKKNLKHKMYLRCLREKTQDIARFQQFVSRNHEIRTVQQNKISLSCYDDKRFIFGDQDKTLAYGHFKTYKFRV